MKYIYDKTNINSELIKYIEKNIFPIYDLNEIGHGINHIITVINHSLDIAKNYNVNLDLVYTVASYHDIGHHIDSKNHEKISAEIMIKDNNLKTFFTFEELNIIKLAIEDHRASNTHEPRNLYGKIISAADKNLNVQTAIKRSFTYTQKYHPEFTTEELLKEVYTHLEDKFGINGYAKVYIKDNYFESFKSEIISLLSNKENFNIFAIKVLKEENLI